MSIITARVHVAASGSTPREALEALRRRVVELDLDPDCIGEALVSAEELRRQMGGPVHTVWHASATVTCTHAPRLASPERFIPTETDQ